MPSTKQAPKDRYEHQRQKSATGKFNMQTVTELMDKDRDYRTVGHMDTAEDQKKALAKKK